MYFQCYDINTLGLLPSNEDELHNCTTANHGPPPSYETVVAMDQGLDACLKCANGTHPTYMGCSEMKPLPKSSSSMFGIAAYWGSLSDISDDSLTVGANNHLVNGQILSVCDMARVRTRQVECCCSGNVGKLSATYQDYELIRKCKRCGKEIKCCHSQSQDGDEDESNGNCNNSFCQCLVNRNGFCVESPPTTARTSEHVTSPAQELSLSNSFDNGNANIPSTSMTTTASVLPIDPNGNSTGNVGGTATALDNDHNVVNLETFNENGLIRMDMSQIIDQTGLPTYEAAIKLESSGYV